MNLCVGCGGGSRGASLTRVQNFSSLDELLCGNDRRKRGTEDREREGSRRTLFDKSKERRVPDEDPFTPDCVTGNVELNSQIVILSLGRCSQV